MTVRLGVLGCGNIARLAHLPSLARTPGVRVVALADNAPANLAAARELAPDARAVPEYADVLAMSDVDAVVVALPPAAHAGATIAALVCGKHVYVEKPLATSVDDAERVLAAWAGTGLVAMMGFNYRYNPLIQEARARITAGALGTLVGARTIFSTAAHALPGWKQRRASGGGVLLDLAVHHVDLIRFLFDAEIRDVSASVRSLQTEDDTAFVTLRLTNDCATQCMFSLSSVEEDRIEVYGSRGKLTVDRYGSLRVELSPTVAGGALALAASRLAAEARGLPYALRKMRAPLHDPSFPAAIRAFVRAVEDRKPVRPDLRDGLRALAVIERAEESARSGRTIALEVPGFPVMPQPVADVTRA